jgi:hypothetical protein
MMHFSNTQKSDHRYNYGQLFTSYASGGSRRYHSRRDAHGIESNNFNIATFGQ